jgi:hypothetical protein
MASPMLFVGNEIELLDERTDWRHLARQEVDAPAPGVEARRHLDLVRLVVGHTPESGEALQRLTPFERCLRRVEDDEVAPLQAFEPGDAAVIRLREASVDAPLQVIARHRVHEVAALARHTPPAW